MAENNSTNPWDNQGDDQSWQPSYIEGQHESNGPGDHEPDNHESDSHDGAGEHGNNADASQPRSQTPHTPQGPESGSSNDRHGESLDQPTARISASDGEGNTQPTAPLPYRPAPEFGAYGPVPPTSNQGETSAGEQSRSTRNNGAAANGPTERPAPPTGQLPPNQGQGGSRPGYGSPYNPYATGQQPGQYPPRGSGPQYAAQSPQNPRGPQGRKYGGTVITAVIAALIAAALVLAFGWAAISNGWITVPSSTALTGINSNSSGSGSATVKSGEAPDWQAVNKKVSDSVVSIQTRVSNGVGKGSGAILNTSGDVVTNNHVVSGAQQIQVALANGQVYSAKVVGTDVTTDLAVVKLQNPPSDLKPVSFADSDKLAVGENVMAIGNPLGYDNTATTGIVSALNRPVTVAADDSNSQNGTSSGEIVTNAVQVDAAINPGNSGGPSFNAAGQVIGINSSIASTATSSSEAGSIGIGFAIPSNLGKRVADEIIKNGKVQHVLLGVTIRSATATADGVTRGGAQVVSVTSGGSAGKAGIKQGDVIVAFNGHAVSNLYSVLGFVRASALNDEVKLTVVRSGKSLDVNVKLDQVESDTGAQSRSENNNNNNDNDNNDNNDNGNGDNGDGGGLLDPFGLFGDGNGD